MKNVIQTLKANIIDQPRDFAKALLTAALPAGSDLHPWLNAATEDGSTFADAIVKLVGMEPANITVSQIAICHQTPWIKISGINSQNFFEFTGADFTPQSIRTETIFSGGLITALCVLLKQPTTSAWTDSCDNSGAGIAEA